MTLKHTPEFYQTEYEKNRIAAPEWTELSEEEKQVYCTSYDEEEAKIDLQQEQPEQAPKPRVITYEDFLNFAESTRQTANDLIEKANKNGEYYVIAHGKTLNLLEMIAAECTQIEGYYEQ